jgi:hypothetical protein
VPPLHSTPHPQLPTLHFNRQWPHSQVFVTSIPKNGFQNPLCTFGHCLRRYGIYFLSMLQRSTYWRLYSVLQGHCQFTGLRLCRRTTIHSQRWQLKPIGSPYVIYVSKGASRIFIANGNSREEIFVNTAAVDTVAGSLSMSVSGRRIRENSASSACRLIAVHELRISFSSLMEGALGALDCAITLSPAALWTFLATQLDRARG